MKTWNYIVAIIVAWLLLPMLAHAQSAQPAGAALTWYVVVDACSQLTTKCERVVSDACKEMGACKALRTETKAQARGLFKKGEPLAIKTVITTRPQKRRRMTALNRLTVPELERCTRTRERLRQCLRGRESPG